MAEIISMGAETREGAGKGAARKVRATGRVPGVIYGNKIEALPISVDHVELMQHLRTRGFFSRVFELDDGNEKHRVLARDVQFHPVTDSPIHVDFLRFSASTRLKVDIEVEFSNEEACPGIKRGGVLNIVRHVVEMICNPMHIPESIVADLTGLDIGDSIHISQISLPEGVEPTIADRDFTVATIAAPTIVVEPEDETEGEEGEEGVEGEEGEEGADEGADGDKPAADSSE